MDQPDHIAGTKLWRAVPQSRDRRFWTRSRACGIGSSPSADLSAHSKNPSGLILLSVLCLLFVCGFNLPAAGLGTGMESYLYNTYNVRSYALEGKSSVVTKALARLTAKYTGTNVSLADIVCAAVDLQAEYRQQGEATMNIVIAPRRITNGIVTLDVFPGAVPQIVVAGERYLMSGKGLDTGAAAQISTVLATRAAAARMATNHFQVEKYLVSGNTLLPPATVGVALAAATNAFGTNVSVSGIIAARNELLAAYQNRGYVTVAVGIPAGQRLTPTNTTVKFQVTEGRVVAVNVKGNHYFSSNNVMRALPSLHTNEILNGKILQAEINRANANQDRQIYPAISPGPDPGTSELTLGIKDQLPMHGKVELNNESSPGTPDLRVNSSAVYNNLWQREQSLGLQYSFSPEWYKANPQWDFYDQPLVANYSGFYRIPLGQPGSIEEAVAAQPGSFGYDEATRKFNLPPASGQPDVTFFASRSTIDTGLETLSSSVLYDVPGVREIIQEDVQQDFTVNNDLGFRLNTPLQPRGDFHSDFASGLDFKTYQVTSYKTNSFLISEVTVGANGNPNPPVKSSINSPVPVTTKNFQYLPLSLRYDAGWRDSLGTASAGLGLSANLWFSSLTTSITGPDNAKNLYYRNVQSLQQITGSSESSGHWVVLTPSFSHTLDWVTNWPTTFKADGQWASEPLISNEQFGIGGVNSVRGYHEGQVFGDTGWHVSLEQQTPPHLVGMVGNGIPLLLRGTVYMDYAETYLLDPLGGSDSTALWGTGFGGVASIGSHWEARFLFSVPLLKTSTSEAYQPFFNFGLNAQF